MEYTGQLKTIAQRLKQRRIDHRMSQQALADKAGVSRLSVSRIENGHSCDLTTFLSLLAALGLLDELMALFAPVIDPLAIMRQMKTQPQRVGKRQAKKKPTKQDKSASQPLSQAQLSAKKTTRVKSPTITWQEDA